MTNPGKYIRYWAVLAILVFALPANAQKLWGVVVLNKSSVYVGEPVQVSVRVYTTTWFTAGVDPGNVSVNGAFTVYFRSVSTSVMRNGKSCPGVEMIFNVFPFEAEDFTFPSLDIHVESPAEGDYKGVAHVIKTPEKHVRVKPVPPGFDRDEWMVTSNLSVNENWSGDVKNVKVGDVLVRKIKRDAGNTVPELIPPTVWDSLPGISMYPARSDVESHKSKTAISATRTETMRYLLEKEGEITIPEKVYTWWNPYRQKLYKRTLPAKQLNVKPNPDLGMLTSIRDSLNAEVAQAKIPEGESAPFTIFGFSPKEFIALLVAMIVFIFLMVVFIRRAVAYRKEYLRKYHASEAYFFVRFKHAVRKGDKSEILKTLYRWIDSMSIYEPSVGYFAKKYGSAEFQKEATNLENQIARGDIPTLPKLNRWAAARAKYLRRDSAQEVLSDGQIGWINP